MLMVWCDGLGTGLFGKWLKCGWIVRPSSSVAASCKKFFWIDRKIRRLEFQCPEYAEDLSHVPSQCTRRIVGNHTVPLNVIVMGRIPYKGVAYGRVRRSPVLCNSKRLRTYFV